MLLMHCKSTILKRLRCRKHWTHCPTTGKFPSRSMASRRFTARQDQFKIPNGQELDQMKDNSKLQEELEAQKKAISEVEAEIRALQSNSTLAEIHNKEAKLQSEVEEMEEKLNKLRSGVVLVKPEKRRRLKRCIQRIRQWRKRKRIFKEIWDAIIWDAITENSPKDQKEFKAYSELLNTNKKRRSS